MRVAAREIGHAVAEVMAGQVAAMVLVALGRDEEAVAAAEPSLAMARAIGSRRFIAFDLYQLGRAGRRHGDRDLARARLDESWAVLEDVGPGLAGAMVLGAKACLAESDAERRDLLARGEALLAADAVSHNHFCFREDAIDASLDAGDLDEALRHADALERYASREPTSWSRFVVARARALVAAQRGQRRRARVARAARPRDRARAARGASGDRAGAGRARSAVTRRSARLPKRVEVMDRSVARARRRARPAAASAATR